MTIINKIVDKPWGRETWLALTDDYCYKRIEINAGHKTSVQFHRQKEETNFLAAGKAIFYSENQSGSGLHAQEVEPGFCVHLPPNVVHCFEAVTDIVLLEASNKYVDDVVRLSDQYGREESH